MISILRQFLNRLGFGETPHPTEVSIIVICVVGGLSYTEILDAQVVIQQYIAEESSSAIMGEGVDASFRRDVRILLISTDLLSPSDTLLNLVAALR